MNGLSITNVISMQVLWQIVLNIWCSNTEISWTIALSFSARLSVFYIVDYFELQTQPLLFFEQLSQKQAHINLWYT